METAPDQSNGQRKESPKPGTEIEISFRELTKEDLPAIRPIEEASYSHPWSDSMFLHEFENNVAHGLGLFIKERGEEHLAGYIFFWIIEEDIHINNIAVDMKRRGQGLGKMLLYHMLSWARSRGARCATLEVRPSNEPALALYRSFGFKEGGLRKKYYWYSGEDALILWLKDLNAFSPQE